jgi:transforming growth factor-beta-induced protein
MFGLKSGMTRVMAVTVLVGVLGGCSSSTAPAEANLVETAQAAGQFNTLLAAAGAAGLAAELSEGGPYTVFAPTDAAFAALPEGTVEGLLADPTALQAVLLYHVVSGRVTSGEAAALSSAPTLNGQAVSIASGGDGLRVGGARVIQADIQASNGIIHVIDAVLIP